jgi:uncharacterized protein YrrD
LTDFDPVSWLLIEPGWTVVARDGSNLGKVAEVVGDSDSGIFNGLSISHGLLRTKRYVPAERVRAITEGRVELDLDAASFGKLGPHREPPPSKTIRSDTTDL